MVGPISNELTCCLLTLPTRLYPAEINGLALRSKGTALGTATNWIFNFMVVEITQIGIQSLQWKFYVSVQSNSISGVDHSHLNTDHLDRPQPLFRTLRVLVLRRNPRQNPGRHRRLLPRPSRDLGIPRQGMLPAFETS